MIKCGERWRAAEAIGSPEKYYWYAVWWRLHAKEVHPSARAGCVQASRSQMALFNDIISRPDHYTRRPIDKTDWQWSGLAR